MNNFQNMYQYPMQKNGITWVQGIEGAKAYQLAPNSNVMMLDSETDGRFYIKTSDNIGMCNLRIFDYTEVTEKPNDMSQYVTRSELEKILEEIKNEQSIQSAKQHRNLITE